MGDTIFSVRVDEDIKNKFSAFAKEAGINNKEFMEELMSLYALNKAAASSSLDVNSDINELQNISRRIVDIFINLISKVDVIEKEKDKINKENLSKYEDEINKGVEEREKLVANNEKYAIKINELENINNKLAEEIKNNNEASESIKALNKIQAQKIEELESKLVILDNTVDKLERLTKEKSQLIKERDNSIALNNTYNEQLENSKVELELLKKKRSEFEKTFTDEYKLKTDFLMEKLDLEKNKAILKLREDNYLTLNKLQEDYNKRIIELLEYNKEREREIKSLQQIKTLKDIK